MHFFFKWPWTYLNDLESRSCHISGHQQFLCDIEIPNHHVTPKEIYGSDTFYLSDLELVHMTLGQGHNTTLFPTNIIIGGKKSFHNIYLIYAVTLLKIVFLEGFVCIFSIKTTIFCCLATGILKKEPTEIKVDIIISSPIYSFWIYLPCIFIWLFLLY